MVVPEAIALHPRGAVAFCFTSLGSPSAGINQDSRGQSLKWLLVIGTVIRLQNYCRITAGACAEIGAAPCLAKQSLHSSWAGTRAPYGLPMMPCPRKVIATA
jgi:hypothetical protein